MLMITVLVLTYGTVASTLCPKSRTTLSLFSPSVHFLLYSHFEIVKMIHSTKVASWVTLFTLTIIVLLCLLSLYSLISMGPRKKLLIKDLSRNLKPKQFRN